MKILYKGDKTEIHDEGDEIVHEVKWMEPSHLPFEQTDLVEDEFVTSPKVKVMIAQKCREKPQPLEGEEITEIVGEALMNKLHIVCNAAKDGVKTPISNEVENVLTDMASKNYLKQKNPE